MIFQSRIFLIAIHSVEAYYLRISDGSIEVEHKGKGTAQVLKGQSCDELRAMSAQFLRQICILQDAFMEAPLPSERYLTGGSQFSSTK